MRTLATKDKYLIWKFEGLKDFPLWTETLSDSVSSFIIPIYLNGQLNIQSFLSFILSEKYPTMGVITNFVRFFQL